MWRDGDDGGFGRGGGGGEEVVGELAGLVDGKVPKEVACVMHTFGETM